MFKAGDPKPENSGRKPGVGNKFTTEVKAILEAVHEDIGGLEKMREWAEENPTEFYKLWAKLLPKDVTVSGKGEAIRIIVQTGVPLPDAQKPKETDGPGH